MLGFRGARAGARGLAPLLLLTVIATAAGLARGQTFPPALPPAPVRARDAGAAPAVKELFVVTATACEVALDGDGKVIDGQDFLEAMKMTTMLSAITSK